MKYFVPTFISNATTSYVNLLITVVIGRAEGVFELGVFGVGFAVLGLTLLVCREVGVNATWAAKDPQSERPRAFARVLVLAVCAATTLCGVGLILRSPTLIITAVAVCGFAVYDFVRLWEISCGRRLSISALDAILAVVTSTMGVTVLLGLVSPNWLLLAWAGSLLVLPVVHISRWASIFDVVGLGDRRGWSFGPQALIGSGSAHIATLLLGAVVSPVIVGQIRAAASLFGVVNIMTSTIQSVAIQALSRAPNRTQALRRWVVRSISGQVPLIVLTAVVSVVIGPTVFGESWAGSGELVGWIAVDAVAVAVGVCAIAAHKVDRKAGNATRVATVGGVLRIALVPLAGLVGAAHGVVMLLAVVSLVSATLWWISYVLYRRASMS